MHDVHFNAAVLARHERSLERLARQRADEAAIVAFEPVIQPDSASAGDRRTMAIPAAPTPQPALASEAGQDIPTLSPAQTALLERHFQIRSDTAPPTSATRKEPSPAILDEAAKAAASVTLTPQQSALLAQSLGLSDPAAPATGGVLTSLPPGLAVSGIPLAKTPAGPALSADQAALLAASFGVAGQDMDSADTPDEPAVAGTQGSVSLDMAAQPFFPTTPRAPADALNARDAYLSAIRAMDLGRYGR